MMQEPGSPQHLIPPCWDLHWVPWRYRSVQVPAQRLRWYGSHRFPGSCATPASVSPYADPCLSKTQCGSQHGGMGCQEFSTFCAALHLLARIHADPCFTQRDRSKQAPAWSHSTVREAGNTLAKGTCCSLSQIRPLLDVGQGMICNKTDQLWRDTSHHNGFPSVCQHLFVPNYKHSNATVKQM